MFFTSCLLILLTTFTFITTQTFAQPNSFTPVGGGKGSDGGSNTNENTTVGDSKKFTPQEVDEIREAKNIWKTDLAEENMDESNKLLVNYDSLYQVYNSIRKIKEEGKGSYTYKIYPNTFLAKIHGTDSIIYRYLVTPNKYFSSFKIEGQKLDSKMQNHLQEIDNMSSNFKFKTTEIINNILPPYVIIDGRKPKASDYEKFITDFFSSNPELIYYCSKRYVKLIENKEYNKLMRLHKTSTNVLDYTQAKAK